MPGTANSIFARILFDRDIVEPIVGVEVTVPVKKSPCLLFLQHCYGREIAISYLENVAEMVLLATRFGEDKLLNQQTLLWGTTPLG